MSRFFMEENNVHLACDVDVLRRNLNQSLLSRSRVTGWNTAFSTCAPSWLSIHFFQFHFTWNNKTIPVWAFVHRALPTNGTPALSAVLKLPARECRTAQRAAELLLSLTERGPQQRWGAEGQGERASKTGKRACALGLGLKKVHLN